MIISYYCMHTQYADTCGKFQKNSWFEVVEDRPSPLCLFYVGSLPLSNEYSTKRGICDKFPEPVEANFGHTFAENNIQKQINRCHRRRSKPWTKISCDSNKSAMEEITKFCPGDLVFFGIYPGKNAVFVRLLRVFTRTSHSRLLWKHTAYQHYHHVPERLFVWIQACWGSPKPPRCTSPISWGVYC